MTDVWSGSLQSVRKVIRKEDIKNTQKGRWYLVFMTVTRS